MFAVHTTSHLLTLFVTAWVKDRKGIVSSTYMSFIGVILSIKGRILFYWVVEYTL